MAGDTVNVFGPLTPGIDAVPRRDIGLFWTLSVSATGLGLRGWALIRACPRLPMLMSNRAGHADNADSMVGQASVSLSWTVRTKTEKFLAQQ